MGAILWPNGIHNTDPGTLDGSIFYPVRMLPFWRPPAENETRHILDGICISQLSGKPLLSPILSTLPKRLMVVCSYAALQTGHKQFEKLSILSQRVTGGRDSYGIRTPDRSYYAPGFANVSDICEILEKLSSSVLHSQLMEVASVVCGRRPKRVGLDRSSASGLLWTAVCTRKGRISTVSHAVRGAEEFGYQSWSVDWTMEWVEKFPYLTIARIS
jgi:hypothetical protein